MLVTTDLLSPNMYALVMMGTPRYLSVFLRPMICSVAFLVATNSEPYVAVSTMACLLKNQSLGVVLTKCNTALTDFPDTMSWSLRMWWILPFSLMVWVYPLGPHL